MKVLALIATMALAVMPALSFADPVVTKTEAQGPYELRNRDNTKLFACKGKDGRVTQTNMCVTYSKEECLAAIPTPASPGVPEQWTCKPVIVVTSTAACAPAPADVIDPDGFKVLDVSKASNEACPGNDYDFKIVGESVWVDHPYPECGKLEEVVLKACGEVVDDIPDTPSVEPPTACVGCDPAPTGDNPDDDDPTRP